MTRRIGLWSAVVCAVLWAGSVSAQEVKVRLPDVEAAPNERADALQRQAEALYEQPTRLRRAAELHEREAAQRSATDPRQVEALDRAARLYTYVGDATHGTELMRRAARQALRRGDVARAAHAFIDAAFIAISDHDLRQANELTAEADLLALSPLLPPSEKIAIIRRIDPARAQLGALTR